MKRSLIALFGILALFAAACGGEAQETTTTTLAQTTTTTTGETTTTTQAPSAPEPGTILKGEEALGSDIVLSDDEAAAVAEFHGGTLVGIVAATLETEYHSLLANAAKDRAEALGFTAEIFDAQTSPDRELQGVESFISKGASVIVVTALSDALGPVLEEAIANGVIVVHVTGLSLAELGAIGISVNDESLGLAAGRAAGQYAAELFPNESVQVAITDYPDLPNVVRRADGIEAGLLEANPNIEVVGRFLGGTPDNGLASLETALQQFPELRGVVGINDAGNLGAYQALLAAGRTAEDTFIYGIDCDPAAVDLIDQGTMYKGCVDTNPVGTGELALDAAAKLLAGSDVAQLIEVPVSVYEG